MDALGRHSGVGRVFIVELHTRDGQVCEIYPTYEAARSRVDQFPLDAIVSLPLIFQELADGSQRLVRDDGKPLQWHRLVDEGPAESDEPVALADESSGLLGEGRWQVLDAPSPQDDGAMDDPLA